MTWPPRNSSLFCSVVCTFDLLLNLTHMHTFKYWEYLRPKRELLYLFIDFFFNKFLKVKQRLWFLFYKEETKACEYVIVPEAPSKLTAGRGLTPTAFRTSSPLLSFWICDYDHWSHQLILKNKHVLKILLPKNAKVQRQVKIWKIFILCTTY